MEDNSDDDIHVCGGCKETFSNLSIFSQHKSDCKLRKRCLNDKELHNKSPPSNNLNCEKANTRDAATTPPVTFDVQQEVIVSESSSAENVNIAHGPVLNVTQPISPNLNDKETSRDDGKPEKKESNRKRHACPISDCKYTSLSKRDLQRHIYMHTGERPFKCDYCPKSFSRQDHLRRHTLRHQGNLAFECEMCPRKFVDKDTLQKHMKVHTDERNFKCQLCGSSFRARCHLVEHHRTHTGDTPFQCSYCLSKFKTNTDRKRHERIHTGEKPYACEVPGCTYKSNTPGNLKVHTKNMHGDKFKCQYCDRGFGTESSCKKHMRVHLPHFSCPQPDCNYVAATKAQLSVHQMKVCAKKSPCPVCGRMLSESTVTEHLQTYHNLNESDLNDINSTTESSKKSTRKKRINRAIHKHKCDKCDSAFVQKESLKAHKRAHHKINIVIEYVNEPVITDSSRNVEPVRNDTDSGDSAELRIVEDSNSDSQVPTRSSDETVPHEIRDKIVPQEMSAKTVPQEICAKIVPQELSAKNNSQIVPQKLPATIVSQETTVQLEIQKQSTGNVIQNKQQTNPNPQTTVSQNIMNHEMLQNSIPNNLESRTTATVSTNSALVQRPQIMQDSASILSWQAKTIQSLQSKIQELQNIHLQNTPIQLQQPPTQVQPQLRHIHLTDEQHAQLAAGQPIQISTAGTPRTNMNQCFPQTITLQSNQQAPVQQVTENAVIDMSNLNIIALNPVAPQPINPVHIMAPISISESHIVQGLPVSIHNNQISNHLLQQFNQNR